MPIVAPLSYNELLIAGGLDNDFDKSRFGDAFVFDLTNESVTRCFDTADLKFTSESNQCAVIKDGLIAAMIKD